VTYIVTIIFVWAVSAIVASAVAPRGRQAEFFVLSLLILGPLGVGFAAVAMPRETVIQGRRGIGCPRCAAVQYIGTGVDEFDCWRCDQRIAVDDWGRLRSPSNEAASKPEVSAGSKPKAADRPTPTGKATKVKCAKCQHIQQVPVSASNFQCEKCSAKLTRTKTS
jgi:hypothetical protein